MIPPSFDVSFKERAELAAGGRLWNERFNFRSLYARRTLESSPSIIPATLSCRLKDSQAEFHGNADRSSSCERCF